MIAVSIGRELRRAQVFLAEQPVDRAGADGREEAALGVDPGVVDRHGPVGIERPGVVAGAQKHRPWRAERDELVRVDRHRVPARRVLQVVARHPVVEGVGDVLDRLAVLAAVELGAALARRGDVADGEAFVERHGDERGLARPGVPLDADALGIDGLVGLEVVEQPAGAPTPRGQRAPVIERSGLTLVDEADDA